MNILVISLVLLALLYFFRFEIALQASHSMSSVIGFALLRSFSLIAIFRISYIFLPYYKPIVSVVGLKVIYGLLAIFSLSLLSQYMYNIIVSDHVVLSLFTGFVVFFVVYGEKCLYALFHSLPSAGKDIGKLFLTYPPKKVYDFFGFYLVLIALFFIPFVVGGLWSEIAK